MEKMDTEKQRQQANLHQKLLERKKRRQDAQKRKQEREMAKELLEQKKELSEVRSEHVSNIFDARNIHEGARDTLTSALQWIHACMLWNTCFGRQLRFRDWIFSPSQRKNNLCI